MKIIIVDEKDRVIGSKERAKLNHPKDIYRVSGLWITNSKGEVLMAQRALTKDSNPGMWGPAAAGTVEVGETYNSNMIKEIKEELRLKNVKLKKGPKTMTSGARRYFCQWHFLKIDKKAKDFKIQKEEVNQVKWISKDKLLATIKKHPNKFIPSFRSGERIKLLCSKS